MKKNILLLLFVLPLTMFGQFPTAIGTKWEYFQFFEDQYVPQAVMPSFEDLIIADTLLGGNTYQVVRRSGTLYHGLGNMGFSQYDTLDGTYYYRVAGTQVRVLDSVVLGTAYESLLYEFGLSLGDTLQGKIKNLINLTMPGDLFQDQYPFYYNFDLVCPQFGMCDSIKIVDTTYATTAWYPAAHTYNSARSIHFLPEVGTVYSQPFIFVLDVYGQHYFLRRVTQNQQLIWENSGFATGLADAQAAGAMELYPNPAQGVVRVLSKFPLREIKLIDGMGRPVLHKTLGANALEATFDVAELPSGLYWLQANGEMLSATRAVMVR